MPDEENEAAEEQPQYAWAQQTPVTRIQGRPQAIIFADQLGAEQPDDSYGVVLADAEVVVGTLFENQIRDGELTVDAVEEGQPRPTDYRIADPDDRDVVFDRDGNLKSKENGPNIYVEGDAVAEDEIIVWYNGMAGQRIGRTLDFNGLPFADYTDSGYLKKGLYQAAEGWRGASSSQRGELVDKGLAPRVVRAPILREDVEDTEVLIDVTRYDGGRGYELHVFDAAEFEDEFGSLDHPTDDIERGQYGLECESEIQFTSVSPEEAEETLEEAGYAMHMVHGDGWVEEPENADYQPPGADSFDVTVEQADEEDIEQQWDEFASMIADEIPDGATPDETYSRGIEGVIEKNSGLFHEVPSAEEIRRRVYEKVAWLDVDEVEA